MDALVETCVATVKENGLARQLPLPPGLLGAKGEGSALVR